MDAAQSYLDVGAGGGRQQHRLIERRHVPHGVGHEVTLDGDVIAQVDPDHSRVILLLVNVRDDAHNSLPHTHTRALGYLVQLYLEKMPSIEVGQTALA